MEMKLSERISRKYPSNVLFTATPPHSLHLEFEGDVPCKEQLFAELEKMNIILERKSTHDNLTLRIGKCNGYYFLTRNGWKVYFYETNWLEPMRWMIYAYMWSIDIFPACNGKAITIKTFSAKQQSLACDFRFAIKRHLEGGGDITASAEQIVDIVRNASRNFCGRFHYALRPVRTGAWDTIQDTNRIMRRIKQTKTSCRLRDLSRGLFGSVEARKELEDYVRMLKAQPRFKTAQEQAKECIRNILVSSVPLADVSLVIEQARYIYAKKDDYSEETVKFAFQQVETALNKEVDYRSINAEALETLFDGVSKAYNHAAEKLLGKALVNLLLDDVSKQISAELNQAIPQIQQINRDLDRFCYISHTLTPVDLPWNAFQTDNIPDEKLMTEVSEWTANGFDDLTTSVSSANLVAWLLQDKVCQKMRNELAQTNFLRPIQINDRGFALAVYAAPLRQEDM